jgi:hypothetical protein
MLKKNDTKLLEKKKTFISLTPIQLVFQMAWIIYNKKNIIFILFKISFYQFGSSK